MEELWSIIINSASSHGGMPFRIGSLPPLGFLLDPWLCSAEAQIE